jgi:pyrroline-5-carboxylate reductase
MPALALLVHPQVLREVVPALLGFVQEHKMLLSLVSNTSLAMIIW